jgi:hypothetical protein
LVLTNLIVCNRRTVLQDSPEISLNNLSMAKRQGCVIRSVRHE